mmetsp:Transcript_44068/g.129857  ORF Transcript_44068/g.129857 Transcript_44068/m.129857 type:complete len:673 (-) Transcript_44068:27-2045(-)
MAGIRVRGREGEAVIWTRSVAQRSGLLSNWMEDMEEVGGEDIDAEFPLNDISAQELRVLKVLCEPEQDASMALAEANVAELLRLVHGANFLALPGASLVPGAVIAPGSVLEPVQHALALRLAGKNAEELRGLLGADSDLSAEERSVARAEPMFTPEAAPSQGHDDIEVLALGAVDVGTLAELKGVNRSWGSLGRRVLCARLCCREGQMHPPGELSDITDLDVESLARGGRPWEAALAGRVLPSLARLHGHGFVVDVAEVQAATDDEDEDFEDEDDEDEDDVCRQFGRAALRGCILPAEGKPPLELLLAAVACAGSGEVCGVPVEMLRRNDISGTLNLSGTGLGPTGARLLGLLLLLPGAPSIDKLDLAGTRIFDDRDMEGLNALIAAIKGMPNLSSLNLGDNRLGPQGATELAKVLPECTALVSLSLDDNVLCGRKKYGGGTYTIKGITALCEGIKQSNIQSLSLNGNLLFDEGAAELAKALPECKSLVSLSLDNNALCGLYNTNFGMVGIYTTEGITALSEGIKQSNITSLSLDRNVLDAKGAAELAKALPECKALVSLSVNNNGITGEAAQDLAKVVLEHGLLTDFGGIPMDELRENSLTELDLNGKRVGVPEALVLAGLLPAASALISCRCAFLREYAIDMHFSAQRHTISSKFWPETTSRTSAGTCRA